MTQHYYARGLIICACLRLPSLKIKVINNTSPIKLNSPNQRGYRFFKFPFNNGVAAYVMALLLAVPASGFAKDYQVEVVVFQNLAEHQAFENYRYPEIEEMTSNAEVWRVEPSLLLDAVKALDDAADYLVLHHFSWGQESLPLSEAASVQVTELDLKGWIKVYANQLLYVNLDLDYQGYRLTEKRRIKLDEKHFFDHPKYGVMVQVSRLEAEVDETPAANSTSSE